MPAEFMNRVNKMSAQGDSSCVLWKIPMPMQRLLPFLFALFQHFVKLWDAYIFSDTLDTHKAWVASKKYMAVSMNVRWCSSVDVNRYTTIHGPQGVW